VWWINTPPEKHAAAVYSRRGEIGERLAKSILRVP
jgi:hypothetical protein